MPSAGAMVFDTVVAASDRLAVIPSIQKIKLGAAHAGQRAHVRVDECSVHIFVGGQLAKTVRAVQSRCRRPPGAETARSRPLRATAGRGGGPQWLKSLPDYAVGEVDRTLDHGGKANLTGRGEDRARTGRPAGHPAVRQVCPACRPRRGAGQDQAKPLATPIPADKRAKLHGARVADTELQPTAPGPIGVERKVPRDGVVMVTRQRLRVGRTKVKIHAPKL